MPGAGALRRPPGNPGPAWLCGGLADHRHGGVLPPYSRSLSPQPNRFDKRTVDAPAAFITHAPFPPLIARQMTSAVAGISMWRTPNSDSASTSALATAGKAPTVPASPAPLTPSGLVLVGTELLLIAIAGRSLARGIA